MFSIMSTAGSGLQAQNYWMNAISENTANSQTPGFGRRIEVIAPDSGNIIRPQGTRVGNQVIQPPLGVTPGAHLAQDSPVFSNHIRATSNAHDVAIAGNGFLAVKMGNGSIAYTRAGLLQQDAQGHLVVPGGYRIEPPVTIPSGATWNITPGGQIMASWPGQNARKVGQLKLALIPNPGGLKGIGQNLYVLSVATGTPIMANPGQNGAGLLQPSALNASGVSMTQELTDVIQAQAAYQMNAKILAISQSLSKGMSQIVT